MALYRNVNLSFWTDTKVDDDFTPEDKYFFLYLLTNPHTNICGCYEISMKQMCRETGYNEDTVLRLLKRMENEHGVIKYSKTNKEVLVLNWCKYNWANPSVKKGVFSSAQSIKTKVFKKFVLDTLGTACTHPIQTSDTDTDTDTDDYADNEEEKKEDKGSGEKKKKEDILSDFVTDDEAVSKVINAWNSLELASTVRSINRGSTRWKMLHARIKQYGLEGVLRAFEMVGESSFLLGKVNDFQATFDWVIKPNNFEKVISGNYSNRAKPNGAKQTDNVFLSLIKSGELDE